MSSPVIDIRGADGNAFSLMSAARRLASQLKLDGASIVGEMQSGDYDHLVRTFIKYFGNVVQIVGYTDPDEDEDWEDDYDCDADE